MTASKRKNESVDNVANQLTRMVIVGDQGGKESSTSQDLPANSSQMTTMERLKKLNTQWSNGGEMNNKFGGDSPCDSIAEAICSVIEDNQSELELENTLFEQAEEIQSRLTNKIHQARDLYRKESNTISDLSEQLTKFQEQRRKLLREIDDLDSRQRGSQEKIAIYQAEALEELDIIADVEEQQKRQVPRLKMTISLYASTTGIKWDFADPDVLSGQMVSSHLWSDNVVTYNLKTCTPSYPWLYASVLLGIFRQ